MSQKIPYLGDFELRVLQLVWENEPCMERQISDLVMKERPVARTTVLKTMQRMAAKGVLVRDQSQTPIRFRAAIPQQQMLPELINRFVELVLRGSAEPLLADFGSSDRRSAQDLQTLKANARKVQPRP